MKILVPVARSYESTNLRIRADGGGIDLAANPKIVINPFDEVAVEEAVKLKEQGIASETVAVTVGPEAANRDALLNSMSIGIDRSIRVSYDGVLNGRMVAHALAGVIQREKPDLVLMGGKTSDYEGGATGGMLAAYLGWPQLSFATKIIFDGDFINAMRSVEGAVETRQVKAPAIITVGLTLNTPRYSSLPNIIKAKKKPIEVIVPAALGLDFDDYQDCINLRVSEPPPRKTGIRMESVSQLVAALNKAGLIELRS